MIDVFQFISLMTCTIQINSIKKKIIIELILYKKKDMDVIEVRKNVCNFIHKINCNDDYIINWEHSPSSWEAANFVGSKKKRHQNVERRERWP